MAKQDFAAGVVFSAKDVNRTITSLVKLDTTFVHLESTVDKVAAKLNGLKGFGAGVFNNIINEINKLNKAMAGIKSPAGIKVPGVVPGGGGGGTVPGGGRVPGGGKVPGVALPGGGAGGAAGNQIQNIRTQAGDYFYLAQMMRAVAGGLNEMAAYSGVFTQKLAGVGAVMKATTPELKMLKDAAIEAGIKTQFSPIGAVEGLTELATAGQTSSEAVKTLIPVLDLAAASLGELSVAKASASVVGILNSYTMGADKAADVTNRMLRITQLTNLQTRDFGSAMGQAASVGGMYQQELNDVFISLGLMRNRSINTSTASTALQESMRRVYGMTLAQNAVTSAGVAVYNKETGARRPIIDIMQDMVVATKNMTLAEKDRLVNIAFGARGQRLFATIQGAQYTTMLNGIEVTLKGSDAIAALRAEMAKTAGVAEEFRKKLLDTFEGQKTLLKGTLQTWAVIAGEPFTRILKPIVTFINNGLIAALEAFKALPAPMQDLIAGIVTSGVAILGAAVAWGMFSTFILPALSAGLAAVIPMLGTAALLAIPLAGAGLAVYAAWTENTGGFRDSVKTIWTALKGLWAIVTSWKDGTAKIPMEIASALQAAGIEDWVIRVGGWLGRVKDWASAAWVVFKQWAVVASKTLIPPLTALWRMGASIAKTIGSIAASLTGWDLGPVNAATKSTSGLQVALGKVQGYLSQASNWLESVFNRVGKWFEQNRTLLTTLATETWDAFKGIGNSIADIFKTVFGDSVKDVDGVKLALNLLLQPIIMLKNGLQSIDWVLRNVVGPTVTWLKDNMFSPMFKALDYLMDTSKDNWKGFCFELEATLIPLTTAWDKFKASLGFEGIDTSSAQQRMLKLADQRGVSTEYLYKHMGVTPEMMTSGASGGASTTKAVEPWKQHARDWQAKQEKAGFWGPTIDTITSIGMPWKTAMSMPENLSMAWQADKGLFNEAMAAAPPIQMGWGRNARMEPIGPSPSSMATPMMPSGGTGGRGVDIATTDNTMATREQTGKLTSHAQIMDRLATATEQLSAIISVMPEAMAMAGAGNGGGQSSGADSSRYQTER